MFNRRLGLCLILYPPFPQIGPMRIANLNPSDDVGASAWLVGLEQHPLLLDAGVHPKLVGRASLPLFQPLDEVELDAIAVSQS